MIVILILVISAIIFINFWPSFGKLGSKEVRKDYEEKTSLFHNDKFHNKDDVKLIVSVEGRSMFKDKLTSYPDLKPKEEIPIVEIEEIPKANIDEMKLTWFGHSTMLLQINGMNILIDPVFSDVTSPVQFVGPKRMSKLPMDLEDLPEIDMLLVSHNHYDHLDYETIRAIDNKVKEYFVPLGIESHLQGWGINKDKINSMAWYDEIEVSGLKVISTPGQHFSGRNINDSNSTLWCGFLLKNKYYSFYYTGDTGKGKFFKEIYEKYGAVDLITTDTAQYNELWPYCHMNPYQAVEAAEEMKATWMIPVHWGGFALANHPWYEPGKIATELGEKSKVSVATPMIGETVDYKEIDKYKKKWWEGIN